MRKILWDPIHLLSKIKIPVFPDFSVSHIPYTSKQCVHHHSGFQCAWKDNSNISSPTIFLTLDLLYSVSLTLKYKIQKDSIDEWHALCNEQNLMNSGWWRDCDRLQNACPSGRWKEGPSTFQLVVARQKLWSLLFIQSYKPRFLGAFSQTVKVCH